jgi:hypothetical protein
MLKCNPAYKNEFHVEALRKYIQKTKTPPGGAAGLVFLRGLAYYNMTLGEKKSPQTRGEARITVESRFLGFFTYCIMFFSSRFLAPRGRRFAIFGGILPFLPFLLRNSTEIRGSRPVSTP